MWSRSTLLSDSCPFPEGVVPQGDNQRDKSMSIKAFPSLSWHPWCHMTCFHPSPIPYPGSSATRLEHTFPRYLPQALERNTQHFLKPKTWIALPSLLFGSRPLAWQSQLFQAVLRTKSCTASPCSSHRKPCMPTAVLSAKALPAYPACWHFWSLMLSRC